MVSPDLRSFKIIALTSIIYAIGCCYFQVDPVQVESLPHAGQLSLISASLAMLTQPGNNLEKFVNLNFKI